MQKQTGSGKITAISLLLIIGLSVVGVIAALSGSELKKTVVTGSGDTKPVHQEAGN